MKNKILLSAMYLGTLPMQAQLSDSDKLPNFVIIMADDMGYGDLSVTGSVGYLTPHLDQMSSEGMRFTQFYAGQPISSASRAGLLTGCYPNRIGFSGALFPSHQIGINDDEELIPEVLQKQGYVSGIFGKWHLGWQKQFLPLQHGFDEYLGIPYSNDMWPDGADGGRQNMPPLPMIRGNETLQEIRTIEAQGELTATFTNAAIDFISRHKNQPFFVYLAHPMPHIPIMASERFRGKSKQGLYGDVIMEIDWSVGEILKALKENGLDENTLVVFTSDNGPWTIWGNHSGSAAGLREGKSATWEGGQRVPCIMRWPGKIPAGNICNALSSGIDLLPTFAALSKAALPQKKIDGVDISPLFDQPGVNTRIHFWYYFNKNNLKSVRDAEWKLVLPHTYRGLDFVGNDGIAGKYKDYEVNEMELYDMRFDSGERYNVINQHPDVVERLLKEVEKARTELGDDITGRDGNERRPIGALQDKQL
ncbi:MAG: sulfatase [Dysgonamonadaceae bacterium]|jgi:arylsulfatase|nr:sulfatase [Dysgonamonadaceae bacterium]